jgi:hypothetical protein
LYPVTPVDVEAVQDSVTEWVFWANTETAEKRKAIKIRIESFALK